MAEKKEKRYVSDNAHLMAEWDWEKNNDLLLDPHMLTQGCHTMAWWKCTLGHSYESQIRNRANGIGCPYCAGKKVLIGYNDLETFYPEVASDWNYDRNGTLTPTTVTYASNKRFGGGAGLAMENMKRRLPTVQNGDLLAHTALVKKFLLVSMIYNLNLPHWRQNGAKRIYSSHRMLHYTRRKKSTGFVLLGTTIT